MQGFITRLFDLREGEGRLLFKSALVLFGLIAAHTLLETTRDALFLGKLSPSRLPLVYVLLAGLSLGVAKSNSRFVQSFGRRNALILTLQASAFGTVLIYLLPRTPAMIFGLYLWSGLLGTVLVVQFWMLAGHLFTVAQSKRLFGPIAAGGVLGAVSGASFAVAALRAVDVTSLMLIAAGLFLATGLLLTNMDVDNPDAPDIKRAQAPQKAEGNGSGKSAPYLLRLGALLSISTAAVLVTDYMFKSAAAASTPPEELGAFFARYYTVLNAVALTMQVLLASSLVQRFGVIAAATVLPALLFFGGIGTAALAGPLIAILITKGADGALRHSLHRITTELLWLPLPDEDRAKSKAFLDTVVIRSVQAVVAGGLFLLATFDLAHPALLGGIVAFLSAVWLVTVFSLRRPYLSLFRNALNRFDPEQAGAGLRLDLNSAEIVIERLSSRDPDRVLAAMELLYASGRSRLIPGLILYHDSEEVLLRGLELISNTDRSDWPPLAERLLDHRSPQIRVGALKALANAGFDSVLERRLLDIDPYVRAHAAFWVARSKPSEDPMEQESIQRVLAMDNQAGRSAKIGLLEAIQISNDTRWAQVILALAAVDDPEVGAEATRAMGQVIDERFIPFLVDRLKVRETRHEARRALVQLGDIALNVLADALRSSGTDPHLRRHLPRSISRFHSQAAADLLLDQLEVEENGLVRYKLLRGLGRLVMAHPIRIDNKRIERLLLSTLKEHLRLLSLKTPLNTSDGRAKHSKQLLLGLLQDKLDQSLERAFRLLQIAHTQEDIRSVSIAASSPDRRVRAQALEFIDALTLNARVPENRTLLKILVDDLSPEDRLLRSAAFLESPPKDEREALAALARDPDEALARIAAYHSCELGGDYCQDVKTAAEKRPFLNQVTDIFTRLSASGAAGVA